MPYDFHDLHGEYTDLYQAVMYSNSTFFEENLRRFLEFIDEQAPYADVAVELQKLADFPPWYETQKQSKGSMVGSGRLEWPKKLDAKLGMQIALFKHFSEKNEAYIDFGHHFLGSSTHFDDMVSEIGSQLIDTFSRDFERLVRRRHEAISQGRDIQYAPASDRIVRLDHNSQTYQEAIESLNELVQEVAKSNSLGGDPEEKERTLAELKAVQSLLSAVSIRVSPVMTTLRPAIGWVVGTAGAGIIGTLAYNAWEKIMLLLGIS